MKGHSARHVQSDARNGSWRVEDEGCELSKIRDVAMGKKASQQKSSRRSVRHAIAGRNAVPDPLTLPETAIDHE